MIQRTQIKPEAIVVCSNNKPFAKVDHVEGASAIKLNKDESGLNHYIPLSWVTKVDDKVHVDRTAKDVMAGWSLSPDAKF